MSFTSQSFSRPRTVLVANRGEIAVRLIRAVHACQLRATAVFVSDDTTSTHIRLADHAINIGSHSNSYSSVTAIVSAARASSAFAVIPGYGFLSEDPEAAEAITEAGIIWLGPTAATIRAFGFKHSARAAAIDANIPVLPGSDVIHSPDDVLTALSKVGLPALLKATAGGGGMGQAVVYTASDVKSAFAQVQHQAKSLFASQGIFVERFVQNARHVEVQIFGDGRGNAVALGDRDCSAQRRRQKVIEEAPAPALPKYLRTAILNAAVTLCQQGAYRSAGTVEFIVDTEKSEFFFLEVNTRLQVEHGITELVQSIDIPVAMIRLGLGEDVMSSMPAASDSVGVAIQARIYAENPLKDYMPSSGTITHITWPDEQRNKLTLPPGTKLRVDKWAETGVIISGRYDPMLGKVMTWGRTRALAVLALEAALKKTIIRGVEVNVALLLQILRSSSFRKGIYSTRLLSSIVPTARTIEVIEPGLQSSLQDYPGRVGYWNIGVSPSGPMDAYAMGMANALVGNEAGACALEITVSGPKLFFHFESVVSLTGGNFDVFLDDGRPVDMWMPFRVPAGATLSVGKFRQILKNSPKKNTSVGGKLAYLAVRGGFDAPKYLGSASTFPTGSFGGLNGSFLVAGDFLPVGGSPCHELDAAERDGLLFRWPLDRQLNASLIPDYSREKWLVAALNGPHATREFLRDESLEEIWTSDYVVQPATNRLGARLSGPTPKWTREDGGSAGLHPSNLHDYTYAPGAVNFSGNTPIVLMLDGPSLGGFVCPITIATADLWKVAQAAPGEAIRFKQVNFDIAKDSIVAMEEAWDSVRLNDHGRLEELTKTWSPWWIDSVDEVQKNAVLASLDPDEQDGAKFKVCYRMSGDEHILVEYGDIELNLAYRLRVHMLMEVLESENFVKELCPGVRSLLIRFDRHKIHTDELVEKLKELESRTLGSVENVCVPSRVLKLPMSFNDRWSKEAQERYSKSVRKDAPYMPSNVEFVRRINGLSSIDEVKDIMINAEYMVLGLGDVYLGAPCAVPVDPRHRMVTSKYNPARTFTPEGAVGIGGAYMCIYGMDSPGGYQLCGRTLPIWDSYGAISEKCRGASAKIPWLLRFFDRVRFYPVTDEELENLRKNFRNGDYSIDISEEIFSYQDHLQFLKENTISITEFTTKRKSAYEEERKSWKKQGETENDSAGQNSTATSSKGASGVKLSESHIDVRLVKVKGGVAAQVWSISIEPGQEIKEGDVLMSLESMKVEISIPAPVSGIIYRVLVEKGQTITPDETLSLIQVDDKSSLGMQLSKLSSYYSLGLTTPSQVIQSGISRLGEGIRTFCEGEIRQALNKVEYNREISAHLPLYGAPFVSYNVTSSQEAVMSAGATCIGTIETPNSDVNLRDSGEIISVSSVMSTSILNDAASFALVGKTAISCEKGIIAMTISSGLIEGGLTVMAKEPADVGLVVKVCLEGRVYRTGMRVLTEDGPRNLGRPRRQRLRFGLLEFASCKAVRLAAQKLESVGNSKIYVSSTPFDEVFKHFEDLKVERRGSPELSNDWWRRVIFSDVWAKVDAVLLGDDEETRRYVHMVNELDLCCLAFGNVTFIAPALSEDALLAIAQCLASSD